VDPDSLDNHVIYELLEVVEAGPQRPTSLRIGDVLAVSAQNITVLTPTDGKTYPRLGRAGRPWWKFW
jgi:hypothetical protein